jgi:uncharacterized protein (DUF2132 family)
MNNQQPNNPLHGITLKQIVERLVAYYGWEQLGLIIEIGCFNYKPSVTSSLRFLRSTPWARTKVEKLYIAMQEEIEHQVDKDIKIDEQPPNVESELNQTQQKLDGIKPHKPYRGAKFESQKATVSKTVPKFKFEYRKSGVKQK